MKNNRPIFEWNDDKGIAICVIHTPYGDFSGNATCHTDDKDMMSKKVGCEIAYCRATIKMLTYRRDCQIKPALKALKQLYYSMKHSKKFNPKSYESKMLRRQIENWEFDLDIVNDMLNTERKYVHDYIMTKELLYQDLRAKRNNGQK